MSFVRRDFLKLIGGTAAGLAATPVPWKLLDDTSIWTQNWPWVPTPPKGEERTRYTTCTLCPAGCGVRARCIGEQPVSLAGVGGHPVSRGALCAAGLAGHHLAYHPERASQPLVRTPKGMEPIDRQKAIAALADALSGMRNSGSREYVAILDEKPGRTISILYRRFLAQIGNGVYLTSPAREDSTLQALQSLFEKPYGPLGLDLENARTILSFGAPLLDGWGTPGRVMEAVRDRLRVQIIQAESRQSRTASMADRWLAINPGSEAALALSLASVILREKLYDENAVRKAEDFESYAKLAAQFTPESVAALTGIQPDQLADTARQLAKGQPSIALGGADPVAGPLSEQEETAIAGLNLLLGSVGRSGAIVPRREVPSPAALEDLAPPREIGSVPDGSVRVLIAADGDNGNTIPWDVLKRKLARNAMFVSLSAYPDGYRKNADYIIPAPAYLESLEDVPSPFDAAAASYSLSAPLLPAPEGATEPGALLAQLAQAAGVTIDSSDAIRRRVEAIHKTGGGTVFTSAARASAPLSELKSAEDLWKALNEGGCWVDAKVEPGPLPRFSLLGKSRDAFERMLAAGRGRIEGDAKAAAEYPLILLPFGWRWASAGGGVSPLMTKLYQESGLRAAANEAAMNPQTAGELGLSDGGRATIETSCGSCAVNVRLDPSVMPGVVEVAAGPAPPDSGDVLALCTPDENCTWRMARAKVSKA